jgi:dihydrodipicolinate synthase/N-acetylneuraminate lyase
MKFKLSGLIPALVTPFTKGGKAVDHDRACALAHHLADKGVAGIFPCGTTGEGLLMTLEERTNLLERLIASVGTRIKVIAHTGCLDTASTIALTRHAQDAGAYAAGIITPGFYTLDHDSIFQHYRAVANAVPGFPILLYNLPSCAKNELAPDLIGRLASEVDEVVGVKDSGGNMVQAIRMMDLVPKGFVFINGADEYTYQAILTGAQGTVSSTSNVVPELFLSIYEAVGQGDHSKALQRQFKLNRLCSIFGGGRYVAMYKEGLRLRGVDAGHVRAPQRELTAAEKKRLAQGLEKEGII